MIRKFTRFLAGGVSAGILLFLALGMSGRAHAQEGGPPGHGAIASGESAPICPVQNGTGSNPVFKPYTLFNCGNKAYGVGAGDLNHDGRTDAVISAYAGAGGYTYQLLVFLQDGSRNLAQPVAYPGGNRSESLAVGDFNHDGWDDVATADWSDDTISVYLQQAGGSLASRLAYPADDGPDSIAVGDLNGDGYDDIVVAHEASATIGVFTQTAAGTLNSMVTYPSVAAGRDDIALGDANGDGRLDVVKMNGEVSTNPHIMVYLQNAGGTLETAVNYSIDGCTQCVAGGLAVGDITGDGYADVALTYQANSLSSYLAVFRQEGAALLPSISYPSYSYAQPVELGPIDWDARLDAAVLHGASGRAGVHAQDGAGALGAETLYPVPYKYPYYAQDLEIADVNSDGFADLLVADGQGLVVLYHKLPAPEALSPSAATSDTTPIFTWGAVSGAEQYRYQVMQGTTPVYTGTVNAGACAAGICSDTPATGLPDGNYTWSAALMLNGIWGDYGAAKSFSVDAVPNLTAPAAVIYDPTPTYRWQKVAAAAQYRYRLMRGTTTVYTRAADSSACGAATCAATPTTVLPDGVYKWQAQAMIEGTWTAYSPSTSFTLKTVPVPQAPAGKVLDPTPAYRWSRIPGATKYRFQLWRGTTLVYARTAGAAACGPSSCSNTPATVLTYNVTYKWRVQAMVGGQWRPYSAYKSFTPNNKPKAGFWKSADGFDRFYVTADQNYVDEFTITVSVYGCGTYQVKHSALAPITNRQFSFGNGTGFYASGTFATTTGMSGTDGLTDYYIAGCGLVHGGPWSYTATWQSTSQPLIATLQPGGPVDIVELIREGLDSLRIGTLREPVR